jgi:hypothetical protein
MKEFEPSSDFVSRVMRNVHAYEAARVQSLPFFARSVGPWHFRYAMSWCGVFFGIILSPAVCL